MDNLLYTLRLLALLVLVVLAVSILSFLSALLAMVPDRTKAAGDSTTVITLVPVPEPPATSPDVGDPTRRIEVRRISFYQAVPSQTDRDPEYSACGPTRSPWAQVAVSRDLFRQLGCGARVKVVMEDGTVVEAVVWDTMAPRWRRTVDVLVAPHEPALAYGVKRGYLEVMAQ